MTCRLYAFSARESLSAICELTQAPVNGDPCAADWTRKFSFQACSVCLPQTVAIRTALSVASSSVAFYLARARRLPRFSFWAYGWPTLAEIFWSSVESLPTRSTPISKRFCACTRLPSNGLCAESAETLKPAFSIFHAHFPRHSRSCFQTRALLGHRSTTYVNFLSARSCASQ